MKGIKVAFIIVLILGISLFADVYKGVKYEIINTTKVPKIKMAYEIRLEKKVSKEFLKEMAKMLKHLEKRKYERTLILYFLPDMKTDSGAWATTHFNPDLKVEILGMTLEEEKELKDKTFNKSLDVLLGKWIDETPMAGAIYRIVKRMNKYYIFCDYKDGSSSSKRVIKSTYFGKSKFEELNNNAGEYYLIENNGKLSIYDDIGIIVTMKAIK